MTTQKVPLNLSAPQGDDEVIYTPLQLSRLVAFVITALRTIRRVGIATCLIVVIGLSTYVVVNNRQVARVHKLATVSCADRRTGRTTLRDLISVAVGDTNFDGIPDGKAPDLGALLDTPQFKALTETDKAMWTLVLNGQSQGGGQDQSTTGRLLAYRAKIVVPVC